jgi:hypothetical protein
MFLKLRYAENFAGTMAVGDGQDTWAYRGNSIFDPYAGAGGHAPYSSEQWTNFYKRYRVFGSSIKVTCAYNRSANSSTADNINGINLYVVPVTDSTIVFQSTLDEMPRCRKRFNWATYQNRPSRIKHYATTRQIFGVSKATASTNAEFSALTGPTGTGSDPSAQWYWWIAATKPFDAVSTVVQQLMWRVEITYYVVLYDRKWLDQSYPS